MATKAGTKNDLPQNALYAFPLMWLLTAGAIGDPRLKPGAWKQTWRIAIETIDGKPFASDGDGEKPEVFEECLDAEDMEDTQKFFSEAAVEQGCASLVITAVNGNIKVAGSCMFNNVTFSATGNGRYDEREYLEDIKLNAQTGGHTFTARGMLTGKYVHDCVPDDDAKRPV